MGNCSKRRYDTKWRADAGWIDGMSRLLAEWQVPDALKDDHEQLDRLRRCQGIFEKLDMDDDLDSNGDDEKGATIASPPFGQSGEPADEHEAAAAAGPEDDAESPTAPSAPLPRPSCRASVAEAGSSSDRLDDAPAATVSGADPGWGSDTGSDDDCAAQSQEEKHVPGHGVENEAVRCGIAPVSKAKAFGRGRGDGRRLVRTPPRSPPMTAESLGEWDDFDALLDTVGDEDSVSAGTLALIEEEEETLQTRLNVLMSSTLGKDTRPLVFHWPKEKEEKPPAEDRRGGGQDFDVHKRKRRRDRSGGSNSGRSGRRPRSRRSRPRRPDAAAAAARGRQPLPASPSSSSSSSGSPKRRHKKGPTRHKKEPAKPTRPRR